jgi:deoxycytidine triphosphate deaminase
MVNNFLFSESEKVARERYNEYETKDPYPEVSPALLNSADVTDYVIKTGMIFPFDLKKLKPTTYALTVGGSYVYWEPNGEKKEGILETGQYITLKKDSILYLTLEPLIQLPHYIAARFNLKIDNVYRGLLLGTGPLVDPGFVGRLCIPLHNFTSNDYQIKGGDTFIWMEFTKISPNPLWHKNDSEIQNGEIKLFNRDNREKKLADYIWEADQRPIQSSIPLSVQRSEQSAKGAQDSAKKAEDSAKVLTGINVVVIVAVLGLLYNVFFQTANFYNNTKKEVQDYQNRINKTDSVKILELQTQIDSLKRRIN